jgi:hypothetical protein
MGPVALAAPIGTGAIAGGRSLGDGHLVISSVNNLAFSPRGTGSSSSSSMT